jgi:hypothetical protein
MGSGWWQTVLGMAQMLDTLGRPGPMSTRRGNQITHPLHARVLQCDC